MIELSDYLVREQGAEINNIRFSGDEIRLLGDIPTLAADEADGDAGFVNTSMKKWFQKVKEKTEKWTYTWNIYFANTYAWAIIYGVKISVSPKQLNPDWRDVEGNTAMHK